MRFLLGFVMAAALAACSSPAATDDSAPALPDPVTLSVETSTWDVGTVSLEEGVTSSLRGVMARPDAPGPHPVALVVHGNHMVCRDDPSEYGSWPCPEGTEIRNEKGLTYLVEALAQRGFIAIAPGVNVQYTWGAGEPVDGVRTAVLLERTWDALATGQLGVDPAQVGDVVIGVGHSRGGQDLQLVASGRISSTLTLDGLVMLMPSVNVMEALPLADLPAVVVTGSCDGDVGVSGGQYISSALDSPRSTPAALLLVEGATHNATNALIASDQFPARGPGCQTPITADDQRSLIADVVPLAALTIIGQPTAHWTGEVFTSGGQTPEGIELAVVSPQEDSASLAQADVHGFAGVTQCPFGYYTDGGSPGTGPCHRPELVDLVGLPASLALAWNDSGASLRLPVAVADSGIVRVRALVDVADERITTSTVTLQVSAGGATQEFDLAVPRVVREEIPPFRVAHGAILWQTLDMRVPQGSDNVVIDVVSPEAGSIQVVSVSAVP